MSVAVKAGVGATEANVTNQNLAVTLPLVLAQSGYTRSVSEVDEGFVTGTARVLQTEASEDFRLRTETDTVLDAHIFNELAQMTGKHKLFNTTMTGTFPGGGFTTNGSAIVTANTGLLLQTYQAFPVISGAQLNIYLKVKFNTAFLATNMTTDIGLTLNPAAAPYAPTDGVGLRMDSTGLYGFSVYNGGTPQTTSPFKIIAAGANWAPVIGNEYDFLVTLTEQIAIFWLDQRDGRGPVIVGTIAEPLGTGRLFMSGSLPLSIRQSIGGTAASTAQGITVVSYAVNHGGFDNMRNEVVSAAVITGGQQGQQGHTQGGLSNYTNNLPAGAGVVLSNTTAAATGEGGQVSVQPTLAAGTDGILFFYTNPAPTVNITGRQQLIKSVKISGLVTTALVGGPVNYFFSVCYGGTAVSLATTESATTKAHRRIFIGQQSYATAAAVGVVGNDVVMNFVDGLPLNPGETLVIAAKNLGTVTSAGVITFGVGVDMAWVL
jgi:hypothetical protein